MKPFGNFIITLFFGITTGQQQIPCPSAMQIVSGNTRATTFQSKIVFLKKSSMATPLKYMVDEKGQKTSVLVPIKTWDKINEDYNKLQNKLNFIVGLKGAFNEVKSANKSGKKLQTLKEFLRESNS